MELAGLRRGYFTTTVLLSMWTASFAQKDISFSTAGFYKLDQSVEMEACHFKNGWYFYKGNIKNAESVSFKQGNNWRMGQLPCGVDLLPAAANNNAFGQYGMIAN